MKTPLAAHIWSPEPRETVYLKARREWDLRMGSTTVQAKNWRVACFLAFAIILVQAVGGVYLGTRPKQVAYIVQVDKLGVPTYTGPAVELRNAFQPSNASLQYHLRRFVEDTRSVSADAAVVKRNWLDAYKLVTPSAANQLTTYVERSNPLKRIEAEERVSIEVNVIIQISRDTWQVDWTEITWDRTGNTSGTTIWRGNFRIVLKVPESEADLADNPIGMFIDEFHWAHLQDAGKAISP